MDVSKVLTLSDRPALRSETSGGDQGQGLPGEALKLA